MSKGTIECEDIRRNTKGEGNLPKNTDAETRKQGEQKGLDTLVVLAVKDVYKIKRKRGQR
jgi:hypothetical protein